MDQVNINQRRFISNLTVDIITEVEGKEALYAVAREAGAT